MTAGSVYIYLYLLSQLFCGKPTKKSPLFLRFEKKNITLVHVVVNFIFIKNTASPSAKSLAAGFLWC